MKVSWIVLRVFSRRSGFHRYQARERQSGQVMVEYVLLMIIMVVMAITFSKQLVGRDIESPGIITSKWCRMMEAIGRDVPDVTAESSSTNASAKPGASPSVCP